MERWTGRVAMVTGANSGIGAAISQALVKNGLQVVGVDLRVDKMEKFSNTYTSGIGTLFPKQCNLTNRAELDDLFDWIKYNLGGVDILVNNAGCNPTNTLLDGPEDSWRQLLELHIFAFSVCTKKAIQSMRERCVDDGCIININSVVGHSIPPKESPMYMYSATKHAITVLTAGLHNELLLQKSKIRVTSLSPGFVNTNMLPDEVLQTVTHLQPEDIANSVIYVLRVPPHVEVMELTIMPMGKQG